ncbi:MAG: type II toxin-antitoxin system RelE/ParE family toxin [Chitinophagales bacterium]
MKIVWSDTAKLTYENLVDFIIDQWGISVVEDFENRVNSLLDLVAQNNHLCPIFNGTTQLRRCVFHPNASLFYVIEKVEVIIIAIVDNRMDLEF